MKNNNMTKEKETWLKAIRYERPDYIPMQFCINDSCWSVYDHAALFELMESHPFLFPNYKRPEEPYIPKYLNVARKEAPYTDDWGCLWETTMDGIVGTVTKHPLADWSQYEAYKIPDPSKCMGIGSVDWEKEEQRIRKIQEKGDLAFVGLRHGHTFLQICDIRGYEEVIFDMQDEEPLLLELLNQIVAFNSYIINKYLNMGVDIISIAEDLGMQQGPMLSPDNFRRYILPCYLRMIEPIRKKGTLIHMHSDGDIRSLAADLMEGGVDILNLQDMVNGISWIKENVKGKVCIDLDIDRQKITPFGTPEDIDRLILEEVRELGSPQGGLMMVYGLYPGVPLANVKAVMDAMEKYAFYY